MKVYHVYCDTNTLRHNLQQNRDQNHLHPDPAKQVTALRRIFEHEKAGRLVLSSSRVALRETESTKHEQQRQNLRHDYNQLKPVPADEKVHGFHSQSDQYGGFASCPLVSDVQDEAICLELCQWGLERRDAQHLTQAVCNHYDVFLTYDLDTIINPYRHKIEARFPIRVMTPSEFLDALERNVV